MYDFSSHLLENEEILYQGKPTPGKGNKYVVLLMILICFTLGIQIAIIFAFLESIKNSPESFNPVLIVVIPMFIILAVFSVFGIYGLIDNVYIKKKRIANDFYCLTNMRAMKYNKKKDELVFGYLKNYDNIYSSNIKNNYGDVHMSITINDYDDDNDLKTIMNIIKNPNPENMPKLSFESIKSPNKVMKLAKEAKQKLNDI